VEVDQQRRSLGLCRVTGSHNNVGGEDDMLAVAVDAWLVERKTAHQRKGTMITSIDRELSFESVAP
jgi:hypothetical protein